MGSSGGRPWVTRDHQSGEKMLWLEEGSSPGTPCLSRAFAQGPVEGHLDSWGAEHPTSQG